MHRIAKAFLALITGVSAAPFLLFFPQVAFGLVLQATQSSVNLLNPQNPSFYVVMPFMAVGFFSTVLLADRTRYIVFSLACLLSCCFWLARWVARKRTGVLRDWRFYIVCMALGCVLGLPALLHYEPMVKPEPDAEVRLVETPGLIDGIVRSLQAGAEVSGCYHEILGWADAQTLVYRQWCDGFYERTNNGQYNPGQPQSALAYDVITQHVQPFAGDVNGVIQKPCAFAACVRPLLSQDYQHFRPDKPRFPNESLEQGMTSPDGTWVAFITEHVYGPQDLLVARRVK